VIRDWAGYWILAALVLFEFWDAQYWHSHYMACCVERTQFRSEQQHQSTLRKPGYRDFSETPVPIGAQPFDQTQPRSFCTVSLDLLRNEMPQNNHSNSSRPVVTDRARNLALFGSSYPKSQTRQAQGYITAEQLAKNHTQSEATPGDFI
jgi:hypothetical protein